MVELNRVNNYLEAHVFADKWHSLKDEKKQSILKYAEALLHSYFNFREGAEDTNNYFHAICEQANHLVNYAPERYQLQQEGVTYYAVDGITFTMKNNLISPAAKGFLKPITKLRVGNVV
ncbi:hypothetical protein NSA56_01835 [Oceanobacillus caeni]|uniref:hypothetical protein n=1 Tax=Oceanobacillus caeni TaxID=405946 RepID=UPI002149A274|nr:hypothetical protein [Oceanobacillus caeni]MCR1833137.1 hypothetical protein [Oceanobacillus caeni]